MKDFLVHRDTALVFYLLVMAVRNCGFYLQHTSNETYIKNDKFILKMTTTAAVINKLKHHTLDRFPSFNVCQLFGVICYIVILIEMHHCE